MIYFRNDYSTLGHPNILQRLLQVQEETHLGYGMDKHCERARTLLLKHIKKEVDIHFLTGGTSANKTIISHILRPYEAVIAASSGHIEVHEAGAIEQTGHKILTIPSNDGKISAFDIKQIVTRHADEHMVIPKMVYLSQATEMGTIYKKQELLDIKTVCKEHNLMLFIDGARLGVSLVATNADVTLEDIASLADVFYIGGTKNGAMIGEAVCIVHPELKDSFRHSIKQHGGLLAKGFLLGLQFEVLFEEELFFELARISNTLARVIEQKLKERFITCVSLVETNQIFIEMETNKVEHLAKKVSFEIWERKATTTIFRLVTTWHQTSNDIDQLFEYIDCMM